MRFTFIFLLCLSFLFQGCAGSGGSSLGWNTSAPLTPNLGTPNPGTPNPGTPNPGTPNPGTPDPRVSGKIEQLTVSITDELDKPFIGAKLLLTENSGQTEAKSAQAYEITIEDEVCVFEDIPYGVYTLSIPGYSEISHEIRLDESMGNTYTEPKKVYTRMDIDLSINLILGDGVYMYDSSDIQLADGLYQIKLQSENTDDQSPYLYTKTLPAGRYVLKAPGDDYSTPYLITPIDLNESNKSFEYTLNKEDQKKYRKFNVTMPFQEVSALLNDSPPVYTTYDDNAYRFIYSVPENEESLELSIRTAGFQDFTKTYTNNDGEEHIQIIPENYDEILTIQTVHIYAVSPSMLPENLDIKVQFQGTAEGSEVLSPDFMSYIPKGVSFEPNYYVAMFYLDSTKFVDNAIVTISSDSFEPQTKESALTSGAIETWSFWLEDVQQPPTVE